MVNPIKGEVAFKADGEDYVLVLDVNALCEAEGALPGRRAVDIMTASDAGEMTATRALFWAGLHEHQPQVVLADAAAIIAHLGIQRARELMGQAITLAFPDPEASSGKPNPRRPRRGARGTGSASTPTG